jgi:ATP-dependent Clp protease ATP-binding subunit ClpA
MNSHYLTEADIERIIQKNEAALLLEKRFPRAIRTIILKALVSGVFLILIVLALHFLVGTTTIEYSFLTVLAESITLLLGLLSLFVSLWLVLFALEMFSLSAHFGGLKPSLSRKELYSREDGLSFELLLLLYRNRKSINLAHIAFSSERAELLLARLGVDGDDVLTLIEKNNIFVDKTFPLKKDGKMLLVSDIITFVYKKSSKLQSFFFEKGIMEDTFFGALDWTERIHREEEKSLRSWSRINLSEIPGIAKDWSYGGAYTLRRYAQEARVTHHASLATRHAEDTTETILSQRDETNALLVGERGSVRDSVVGHLALRIHLGTANPVLEGRHIFILNSVALSTANTDKTSYERELLGVLTDSAKAGNVILVIENIADFLRNAELMDVNVLEIFDPFLSGDALQIIATTTHEELHTALTHYPFIRNRFEPVLIPTVAEDELVYILSYRALVIEARERNPAYFTFQAIERVADLARTVLQNPILPDDALDLLESAYSEARHQGRVLVMPALIDALVTERTGIPVGTADAKEKQELLNLEDEIARMVVGQKDAIRAVADALRRARSGISTGTRPLGSFLFLGPTGVGKTQVARALERALFNRDDAMIRLDMTEFSGRDALERLIGEPSRDNVGILESNVTRTPYGVLLLDEFEKASPEVRNLFLQILDEGFYSNARGKRISLRNLVIIATSNAGSKDIIEATLEHKGLAWFKDTLVKKLISSNVFRPELLNRFDDIILFEPLSKEDLRDIARLELDEVAERTKGALVRIDITDDLLDFVVSHGYEPEFGARPMKRIIQQTVERILSEKILRGETSPGSLVSFSKAELEKTL